MKVSKMKKAQAGLSVANKRVGPVDPNGAWTKVQEDNLPPKNKKTPVSLTKDKEQGATQMKMGGSIKKIASGKKMAKTSVKMAKKKNEIMMDKSQTMKNGGKAKKKNWIQEAVNPKHKGYCTPMTKATCTPKRKALAMTFKAMGRARKAK
jgi:hypothetical protein